MLDAPLSSGALVIPQKGPGMMACVALLRQLSNLENEGDHAPVKDDSARGAKGPMPGTPEKLLTPKEVAEWLGVTDSWVLDHASRRKPQLESVKLGKLVRFRREDVEDFIRECRRIQGALA